MPTFLTFLLVNFTNRHVLGSFFCFFSQDLTYGFIRKAEFLCQFGINPHDRHRAVQFCCRLSNPRISLTCCFSHSLLSGDGPVMVMLLVRSFDVDDLVSRRVLHVPAVCLGCRAVLGVIVCHAKNLSARRHNVLFYSP